MNLRKFLAMRNQSAEATCVTIGVDDYRLRDSSNLLSVSIAPPGEDPETIYIRGADAAKVEKYTGVSPEVYHDEAVGLARAQEIVEELLKTELIVSYSVRNYSRPWAMRAMPAVFRPSRFLWFDVLSYVQYGDEGRPFPVSAKDMDEVCAEVNNMRGMKFADAVASRLPHPDPYDESEEMPELVRKIHQVCGLWKYCLDREL